MTEQTGKILLVDTDQAFLMQLSFQLQRAGYQVVLAESGKEALDKALSEKPVLTILDLAIPDLAGKEICRCLRKADLSMYVIILTSQDSRANYIAGLEVDADDYIIKPINTEELILHIRTVLQNSNRAKQPPLPYWQSSNQPTILPIKPGLHNQPPVTTQLAKSGLLTETRAITAGTPDGKPLTKAAPYTSYKQTLDETLQTTAKEVQSNDIAQASEIYLKVLKLDPNNETALIWLAWHTADPYEGVRFLEKLVVKHPENAQFREYLEAGSRRVQELDQLISGSDVLGYWNKAEQIQQERIQNGRDLRCGSVTPVGQLLLKRGIITTEQLETGLVIHEMFARLGEPKKLGEVLLDYGYLNQEQLHTVLSEQQTDFNSQFY